MRMNCRITEPGVRMIDHEAVVTIALRAGEAIMEVYNKSSPVKVTKKDDDSPLTEADLAAHEVIIAGLKNIDNNIPIVSEEGRIGDPTSSPSCWLVDPTRWDQGIHQEKWYVHSKHRYDGSSRGTLGTNFWRRSCSSNQHNMAWWNRRTCRT